MELQINNQSYTVDAPEREMLIWVLRDELGLTGSKIVCGIGICGCCTVHVDGRTVRACITPVGAVVGTQIHEVTCVADPGLVVNPDSARAQAQGSIMMGLSSPLLERLTVENGMIVAGNFDQYPLITLADTPHITVDFIESADHPVGGMGEAAIGPIPAAVANAVFALTGRRLRELPLRLEVANS